MDALLLTENGMVGVRKMQTLHLQFSKMNAEKEGVCWENDDPLKTGLTLHRHGVPYLKAVSFPDEGRLFGTEDGST